MTPTDFLTSLASALQHRRVAFSQSPPLPLLSHTGSWSRTIRTSRVGASGLSRWVTSRCAFEATTGGISESESSRFIGRPMNRLLSLW